MRVNFTLMYYASLAAFVLAVFPLDIPHIIIATGAYFLGTVSLAVRTKQLALKGLGL